MKFERRSAGTEDLPQMKQLWMDVFGDSESFTDFYFARVFPRAEGFLIYNEETLVAMLFSLPHTLTLDGELVSVRYLSGVATHPDFRHRGLMTQLLVAAEEATKQAGVSLLYLAPVDPAIYVKAGYVLFGRQRHVLRAAADACAPFVMRPADASDHAALAAFANSEVAAQSLLYEQRTAASFELLQSDLRADGGELYLCFDAAERLCAYVGAESEREARESILPKELSVGADADSFGAMVQGGKEGLALMARCFDDALWTHIKKLAPTDIFLPELY